MNTSPPHMSLERKKELADLEASSERPTKKALIIAVQYHDLWRHWNEPALELPNAHKDIDVIRKLLTSKYNYRNGDIKVLCDDPKGESRENWPTKGNILSAIKWLVEDTTSGDHLVFHFSGHGSQLPAENDDNEIDGMDELIWPCDVVCTVEESDNEKAMIAQDNFILDDTLKEELVDSLPPGVRLTAIFDACHSGTSLDLLCEHSMDSPISPRTSKFRYEQLFGSKDEKVKQGTSHRKSRSGKKLVFRAPIACAPMHLTYDASLKENDGVEAHQRIDTSLKRRKEGPNDKSTLITSWSACSDEQIELESKSGGMLVKNLAKILNKSTGVAPTNGDVLSDLTHVLCYKVNEAKTRLHKRLKLAEESDLQVLDEVAQYKEQLAHLEKAKPKPVFGCMVDPEERLKEHFVL